MAAAPKGLFLVGPPALTLDGDTGSGRQPLCFVEQTTHDMRIGYYTDTYRRTAEGWRLPDAVDDLPAQERGPRLRSGPRPDAPATVGPVSATPADDLTGFRRDLDSWLEAEAAALAPGFEGAGSLDQQMAQLSKVKRLAYDAGWMRAGWPERVGGLGGTTLTRAYLGEALTARDLVEPGLYSMTEVLAPTMIDYADPDLAAAMVPALLRGDETWCQGFSEPGHREQPRLRWPAGPSAPTAAGASTARRSGPAWPSTPTAVSC